MTTPAAETRIEDGIEYFTWTRADGTEDDGAQCARCGSSAYPVDCEECGGEGGYFGEEIAGGYDFGWIDENDWYTCRTCRGRRAFWTCCSGREWCEANPLPGRERIHSTALTNHDDP